MKRRNFLRNVGASTIAVATLPNVIDSFAIKALAAEDNGLNELLEAQDKILVLIQMQGGNDGLNTVIPFTNDLYYSNRPTIAIKPNKSLPLTSSLALHPSLSGFKSLYDEGKLAVVQGVTYPNPDRSHFRGTDIWLTATDADVFNSTGWVGRYLETLAPGYPAELPAHPLAVQVGTSLSLGLQGTKGSMGISFRDPDEFYRVVNTGGAIEEVPSAPATDTASGREVQFMRNIARSADVYASVVKAAADAAVSTGTTYPQTDIAGKLRVVSQLISGGLKTRIYLVSWANNNFDTHANQVIASDSSTGTHAGLLQELNDAVVAFMADMKKIGRDESVSGMTFSEFGRRVAENGSTGTDHGTAAPLFVFGSQVKGGVFGKDPNLSDLDERGDLLMEYDYRQVYASVLLQWFGTNANTAQQLLFKSFSESAPQLFNTTTSVQNDAERAKTIISMGPNPASTHVTVRANVGIHATAGVELRTTSGQKVAQAKIDAWTGLATIDVSALSSGVYVVSVIDGRNTTHSLLTIRH